MEDLLVYGEYSKLINEIKYIHLEQTEHRFETSKILLGTFAIIGALLFTKIQFGHLQALVIAALFPFLGVFLIFTQLGLDLAIKERLRLSCFFEAFNMERKYKWLPKFHTLMIDQEDGHYHGSGHKKINYYLGCIGILLSLSLINFILFFQTKSVFIIAGMAVATACIYLIIRYLLIKIVGTSTDIMRQMKSGHIDG